MFAGVGKTAIALRDAPLPMRESTGNVYCGKTAITARTAAKMGDVRRCTVLPWYRAV